ncbi:MAG: hypothetical protein HYY29_04400 [Chloroflexi bacterium]|nr:hypothetical protein [Chloroflexota bacterium]
MFRWKFKRFLKKQGIWEEYLKEQSDQSLRLPFGSLPVAEHEADVQQKDREFQVWIEKRCNFEADLGEDRDRQFASLESGKQETRAMLACEHHQA